MKIVDRKTFLAMPAETLFSKYQPCVFGDLCIKGDTILDADFYYQQVSDAIDCGFGVELTRAVDNCASIPMEFECQGRDGLFDQGQLFAVWENDDVKALLARLQRCV